MISRMAASRSTPLSVAPLRRSRFRISTAAQSGVRPYQSAARTSAPRSTSSCATAICAFVIAISSGVMPFGSARVQIGPGVDERARGGGRAVARRKEQRRHATGRRLLLALRRHAAADDADAVRAAAGAWRTRRRLGAHARPRLDRGAAFDEQLDGGAVVGPCRPHQRGVTELRFRGVDLRAGVDQQTDRLDVAGTDRRHQQRLPRRRPASSAFAPASSRRRTMAGLPCSAAIESGVTRKALATVAVARARRSSSDRGLVIGPHGPMQRRGAVARRPR